MLKKTKILTVTFGLICCGSLPAMAQDIGIPTSLNGLKVLENRLPRQVEDYAKVLVEDIEGRDLTVTDDGSVRSVGIVGRQLNIAVGRGARACSSVGGKKTCATGKSTISNLK